MIPHDSIRKNVDRSWSLRLVEEIAGGLSSDLEEIYETLEVLSDPRVLEPLTCLLENRDLPEAIRRSASDSLCWVPTNETSEQRLAWWASNDPVLVRHAIMFAEGQERDLVEAVARDPAHVFHLEAIEKIQWWDNARFQNLLIAALQHPDARVRAQAADGCRWQEPVRAQEALLEIASAGKDADRDLVLAALFSLHWYSSQKVLLGLEQLVREGPAEFYSDYAYSFEFAKNHFVKKLRYISEEEGPWLYTWLEPVAHLLNLNGAQEDDDEGGGAEGDSTCDASKPERKISHWNCQEIIAEFENADGFWHDKLYSLRFDIDWQSFSLEERVIIADYLSHHPDSEVRETCCSPLAEWGMTEHLVRLLDDPVFSVAKYSAYYLCELPRNEALAPILWRIFQESNATSMYAYELFESYLVHAPEQGLDEMLVDLAINDDRESIIELAIDRLFARNNFAALQSIMHLLKREPLVTWRVHANLVGCLWSLELPMPDISHLMEVDDLNLQSEIAKVLVARNLPSVKRNC